MADLTLSSIEMGSKIKTTMPDIHAYSYLARDGWHNLLKITASPSVEGTSVAISPGHCNTGYCFNNPKRQYFRSDRNLCS